MQFAMSFLQTRFGPINADLSGIIVDVVENGINIILV